MTEDGALTAAWITTDSVTSWIQAAMTANPPAARRAPVIGAAEVGAPLTCGDDRWVDAASRTITRLRGGQAVGTGAGYTVAAADRGTALTCRVEAFNAFGTATAESARVPVPAG